MPGTESFQTLLRLVSRLAFEVFLFGTAISVTPPLSILKVIIDEIICSSVFLQKFLKDSQPTVNFASVTAAWTFVSVFTTGWT